MAKNTFLDCIGLQSVTRDWSQDRFYFRTAANMARVLVNMGVPRYRDGTDKAEMLNFAKFYSCHWNELRHDSVSNVAFLGVIAPDKDLTDGLTTMYSVQVKDYGTAYFFAEEMDLDEITQRNPLVVFVPKSVCGFLLERKLLKMIIDVLEQVSSRKTGDMDRDFTIMWNIANVLQDNDLMNSEEFKVEEMFACYFHECSEPIKCDNLLSVGELDLSDMASDVVLNHIAMYRIDTDRCGKAHFLGFPQQDLDGLKQEEREKDHLVIFLTPSLASKITDLPVFHRTGMVA